MNKKIIGVLVAIIIVLVAALAAVVLPDSNKTSTDNDTTTNTTVTDKKWVLVNEKDIDPIASEIVYEAWYEYDEQGRMIKSYDTNATESIDFVYDDRGNVISKNVSEFYYGTRVKTNYVYKYDESDNCIEKIITYSDGDKNIYKYEYDEYGNLLSELNESNGYISRKTAIDLVYDNNLIIKQKLLMNDVAGSYTDYQINEYDENDNLIRKKRYNDFTNSDEKITVDGAEYSLGMITEYTYKSVDIVLNSEQSNITFEQTTTPTTEPEKLSQECDMILCTGYDDNNYYELVANQIDGYPDSTFEFGVIKNNEWLIEMSEKCPFIDEEGWWKGLNKSYSPNTVYEDDFYHIGGSVFLYKENTIYNPETGVVFYNLCNRDYKKLENYKEFVGYESYHQEGTANHYVYFKYFNTQTGNAKEIGGYFSEVQRPEVVKDISEGLFYAKGETWKKHNFNYIEYNGFFNINGTMVLDLSEYSITDYHGYRYENGEYTITCKNNSGVKYDITFDTTGKIIKQEKSAS